MAHYGFEINRTDSERPLLYFPDKNVFLLFEMRYGRKFIRVPDSGGRECYVIREGDFIQVWNDTPGRNVQDNVIYQYHDGKLAETNPEPILDLNTKYTETDEVE
jgi:hypothetical protein